MTTEDSTPTFDVDRVAELIENHRNAETRQEQREIEDEVLEETVWTVGSQAVSDLYTYTMSRDELKAIYSALEEHGASDTTKMIIRRKYVEKF